MPTSSSQTLYIVWLTLYLHQDPISQVSSLSATIQYLLILSGSVDPFCADVVVSRCSWVALSFLLLQLSLSWLLLLWENPSSASKFLSLLMFFYQLTLKWLPHCRVDLRICGYLASAIIMWRCCVGFRGSCLK